MTIDNAYGATQPAFLRRRGLNMASMVAGTYLTLLCVAAVLLPLVMGDSAFRTDPFASYQPPSMAHLFGTDQLGRDVLARIIVAARLDLLIAFSSVTLATVSGTAIGAACGYHGGLLDRVVGRVFDVLLAFPFLVAAMAMVVLLGNKVESVIIATAVINVPIFFRLVRAEVARLKNYPLVEAAKCSGNSHFSILARFLLPNCLPIILVQFSVNLGWAVINAASLSFLGLGIKAPTPEWGVMVAEGIQSIMSGQWWVSIFPGLALTLTVMSFNLFGDAARDFADRGRA